MSDHVAPVHKSLWQSAWDNPILLLALTVTLFSSIFYFVNTFPQPAPQPTNQFTASLQYLVVGVTTKIVGVQPDTGVTIPPTTLAFTYAPDEGGYCKLYGIRYQLDNEGIDYKQFLGKPLDITVTTTDPAGTTATAKTRVNIAPTLLNP